MVLFIKREHRLVTRFRALDVQTLQMESLMVARVACSDLRAIGERLEASRRQVRSAKRDRKLAVRQSSGGGRGCLAFGRRREWKHPACFATASRLMLVCIFRLAYLAENIQGF